MRQSLFSVSLYQLRSPHLHCVFRLPRATFRCHWKDDYETFSTFYYRIISRRDGCDLTYGNAMSELHAHQLSSVSLVLVFGAYIWLLVLLAVAMLPSLMFWLRKTS